MNSIKSKSNYIFFKQYNELEKTILSNKRFKNYIKYKHNRVFPNFKNNRTHYFFNILRFLKSKPFLYSFSFFSLYMFMTSQHKTIRNIRFYIARPVVLYLCEILKSPEMVKAGADLISGLFKQELFYNAVLELLINVLRDPIFVNETKIFGKNLFKKILEDDEFQREIINLIERILHLSEIKYEGMEIFKYIIERKESKEILSNYFKSIFQREDIFHTLSHLFLIALIKVLDHPESKDKFSAFLTKIWADKDFRWFIIKKTFNFWSTEKKLE